MQLGNLCATGSAGFSSNPLKGSVVSGTWRKVFEPTAFEVKDCEFTGWYSLTFIVFYLELEKEPERNYEAWAASLG